MFEDFREKGKEIWLQKLQKDLKGKSVESLDWKIEEDLAISAFLSREDLKSEASNLPSSSDWKIASQYELNDPIATNKLLLADLAGGMESIQIKIHSLNDINQLAVLFKGVILDFISIDFYLENAKWAEELAVQMKSICDQQELGHSKISIGINLQSGSPTATKFFLSQFPQTRLKVYPRQNLSLSKCFAEQINRGIEILEEFEAEFSEIKTYLQQLDWVYNSEDTFFVNVASIRAIKVLWGNVLQAYDLPLACFVESHIQVLEKEDDLYTNMIHASSQALSSVCASCDRLLISTSDKISEQDPSFVRRITRNIHHILKMESYLDRVQDPSKGSYSIEVLTKEIADKNWKYFLMLSENQKAGI